MLRLQPHGHHSFEAVALPEPARLMHPPGADAIERDLYARAAAWMLASGHEVGVLPDGNLMSMDMSLVVLVGAAVHATQVRGHISAGRTVMLVPGTATLGLGQASGVLLSPRGA